MSQVYFISDLHLGHKNILNFAGSLRGFASSPEEHDEVLVDRIASSVNKRDMLFILGDVAMSLEGLSLLDRIKAKQKILVRGNHDIFSEEDYRKYFDNILGLAKYKGMWLSHAPIHTQELRGKLNLHGHVHGNSITDMFGGYDKRYINCCVENCNGYPISLQSIKDGSFEGIIK